MTEHDFQVNIVNTLKRLGYKVYALQNAQIFMSVIRSLLYIVYKSAKMVKIQERKYFFRIMASLKKAGFHNGLSDVIVVRKGVTYYVEIKKPVEYTTSQKTGKRIILKAAGTQRPAQIEFQKDIEDEGCPYYLIDSHKKFEEFLEEIKK